jgi:hypothetical protein
MVRKTDIDRAKELGMSLKRFQELMGADPLDEYPEYAGVYGPSDDKKKKKKEKEKTEGAGAHDNFTDVEGIGDGTMVPYHTDRDVDQKRPFCMPHYWDRPILTPADVALYYGFHVHSKDNVYGLHAHYPGGPLGGGHVHGPQNPMGYHTHRYDIKQLTQFKFARPGVMIELDGPHSHGCNAPDGKHHHDGSTFGPAIEQDRDVHMEKLKREGEIN